MEFCGWINHFIKSAVKSVQSVPLTHAEAMKRSDAEKWKEAEREEIRSQMENKTWILVPRPKDRNVVVGVISTKLRELEDKEEMKARIYKAAEFVAEGTGQTKEEALKQICVSPQCGFSTHESGYPLSEEDEKKKLSLVRQIADEIWGEP